MNLAAIREAEKQNVRFMIATGRSVDTIAPTVKQYDLHCGLILLNETNLYNILLYNVSFRINNKSIINSPLAFINSFLEVMLTFFIYIGFHSVLNLHTSKKGLS